MSLLKIEDFDYKFYLSYYPDLLKNKINTPQKAYEHYKLNGIKEGRYGTKEHSKIFYNNSWTLYNNIYCKEHNFKSDKSIFNHYMTIGKKNNYKLYPLTVGNIQTFNWDFFDSNFYIEFNKLKISNERIAKKHFIEKGHKLNYLYHVKDAYLYYNYDWDRYMSEYSDLKFVNIKEGFKHYIDFGKNENRQIYKKTNIEEKIKNLNWKFYLNMNSDLIKNGIVTKYQALEHFKKNGYNEGRLYSHYHYLLYINHDWDKYSKDYKLNKNNINSFKYYIEYGYSKKHKITEYFNEKNFYIDFFKNFNNLTHFTNFEECKNYYNKLTSKIPYSFEHFLIYNLFNWEKIFLNNKQFCDILEINDHNKLFTKYIYSYSEKENNKINLQLILNDNLDLIYNFKEIDILFSNVKLLNTIVYQNISINNETFLIKLIEIQNKINDLISFNFSFIQIPPGFSVYKYDNDKITNQDLRFVFVISSFNNQDNIYNNLLSIIYQNYSNWFIYYTNDASIDKTDELFKKIVKDYNIEKKVQYIHNDKNMKQSYCKYKTYQKLFDHDIVCILDGDDWLARNDALFLLYHEYKKTNNLVIYSGYHIYYNNKIDKTVFGSEYPDDVKKNSLYRTYKNWMFTHIKTGYAWLFKKIPENYLKYSNNIDWLDRCTDLAEMFCVSEIARKNVKHLNKILCVYNKKNSVKYLNSYYNDSTSLKRKEAENHVKSLKPLFSFLPRIFIINLKNRTDLKQNLIEKFNNLLIHNYEFFEAYNGYTNKTIIDKYEEYLLKYEYNKIPRTTLTVTKKHINSLGALGVIYSTIELYKHINKSNINYALILEDDVYFHKDFYNYYYILDSDMKNKDFIYLGYNSLSKNLMKIMRESNSEFIYLNNLYIDGGIYGAYSYICSRKYREKIISLGVDYYINNNINLDAALNIFFKSFNQDQKNNFNFYIYNRHLFIPEVRKEGINSIRNDNFYKDRLINLDNYVI